MINLLNKVALGCAVTVCAAVPLFAGPHHHHYHGSSGVHLAAEIVGLVRTAIDPLGLVVAPPVAPVVVAPAAPVVAAPGPVVAPAPVVVAPQPCYGTTWGGYYYAPPAPYRGWWGRPYGGYHHGPHRGPHHGPHHGPHGGHHHRR